MSRTPRQRAASRRNLEVARRKRRKAKPKYGYNKSGKYVGTQRSGKNTRRRKR